MAKHGRKLFYKIGEVSSICRVKPHVLRYWESEFALLSPKKNRAGQRIYRQKDLKLIEQIKHLLGEEGYTIPGANKKLLQDGWSIDLPLFQGVSNLPKKGAVAEMRQDLEKILESAFSGWAAIKLRGPGCTSFALLGR